MTGKRIDIDVVFKTFGEKQLSNAYNELQLGAKNFSQIQEQFGHRIAPNIKLFKKLAESVAAKPQKDLEAFARKHKKFGDIMHMTLPEFNKFKDVNERINQGMYEQLTPMGKLALSTRHLMHGFRGFKMEMLSVMFFGMGMQKFFGGLLKPAMETVGIFQLLGEMLAILFLPIALVLLKILYPIFLWLVHLDPEVKKIIGAFVLFAVVLGIVLATGTSLVLFIGGIIEALSGIGVALTAAGLTWGGVFAGFMSGAAILGGIFAVIALLWMSDLGGFRDFVKNTFDGILIFIKDAMNHIYNIVKLTFETISAVLQGDWDTVEIKFEELGEHIGAVITKAFLLLGKIFFNIGAWMWNTLVDLILKVIVGGIYHLIREAYYDLGRKIPALEPFTTRAGIMAGRWEANIGNFADLLHIRGLSGGDMSSAYQKVDAMFGLAAEKGEDLANIIDTTKVSGNNLADLFMEQSDGMKQCVANTNLMAENIDMFSLTEEELIQRIEALNAEFANMADQASATSSALAGFHGRNLGKVKVGAEGYVGESITEAYMSRLSRYREITGTDVNVNLNLTTDTDQLTRVTTC